jgi:hypothetical protein
MTRRNAPSPDSSELESRKLMIPIFIRRCHAKVNHPKMKTIDYLPAARDPPHLAPPKASAPGDVPAVARGIVNGAA